MGKPHDEYNFPMPPVSWAALGSFAEAIAEQFFPYTLTSPTSIDFKQLMNFSLPFNGFEIYPVEDQDLPNCLAVTLPSVEKGRHVILLNVDQWDAIDLFGGTTAHQAKATLLHEFSHALLNHDYRLGLIEKEPKYLPLLARKKSLPIKPYEDPEAQAWCLAGHLAMPRKTLEMIPDAGIFEISQLYGVSTEFVQSHLRRLKMIRPFRSEGGIVSF